MEACHLGIRKVFDSVSHGLIPTNLTAIDVDVNVITWIRECFTVRSFYARVYGVRPSKAEACSVVPQGSTLGPGHH